MTEEEIGTAFGARVRHLRQNRGLTRTELAAQIGLHANDIVALERDGSGATLLLIHQLADALDVLPRDIM